MYLDYFGFNEAPFSIAPDPRYLYLSPRHDEALAHLLFGLQSTSGGFVLLTGEVGTGKTTVCRCVLERAPQNCDIAFVYNPKLSIPEFLSAVCDELHIAYPARSSSAKVFVDRINERLLESYRQGRKTVLIIDEAQNLEPEVLEQLRLLTNLETNERKLLQIILIGQPELLDRLARPELRQLAQRIVARYHLTHLAPAELEAYVQRRLAVAGLRRKLFPAAVLKRLYRLSGGIPRLVNIICDRALLGAYVQGLDMVDRATLEQAAKEVLGQPVGAWAAALRRPWAAIVRRGWEWRAMLMGLALTLAGMVLAVHAVTLGPDLSVASAVTSMPTGAPFAAKGGF
jgi:general secretion pathway protein A